MEAVLPVEYVDFDHSVEETGIRTLVWSEIFLLNRFFVSGDVSQMSAEEYLSWVRYYKSFYEITT
jgi:hypothetical protein